MTCVLFSDPSLLQFLQSKAATRSVPKPVSATSPSTSQPVEAQSESNSTDDTRDNDAMATEPVPEAKNSVPKTVHFSESIGRDDGDIEHHGVSGDPPIEVKKEWVNMDKVTGSC